MQERIDYEIRSAVGALIFTTDDLATAKAKCRELSERLPNLKVEEVRRLEVRRRVFSPRLRLVEAA